VSFHSPKEFLQVLQEEIRPLQQKLAQHQLFRSFKTIEDLHLFMQSHVFAVWDFMSLLKALQRGLTCVEIPWTPRSYPESRYLVNQIVLGEECDSFEGRHLSHFELYLEAMRSSGANAASMERMLKCLTDGMDLREALTASHVPAAAASFVNSTFRLIGTNKLHVLAAAFTFGREDLIPDMFRRFLRDLDRRFDGRLEIFIWYLERHIEVDDGEHGPMALRMVSELCGTDRQRWGEATSAVMEALRARLALWDGIALDIQQRQRPLVK
jgi:Protein of unknown function (DUF3050)